MQSILSRYAHLPGNRELVFKSLCALLAENPAGLDWSGFERAEWELLAKMALQESVAEMAYYLLRTEPDPYHRSAVEADTYQQLEAREAATAIRNAVLFKQLDRIVVALGEMDVPVVLLKGADLARSLYPEPGLRSMSDLDLLVPQPRFEIALARVHSLGYREYLPEAAPGLDNLLSHHAHLRKDGQTSTLLELHWSFVATSAFRHAAPMDWFWANLAPFNAWGGQTYPEMQKNVYVLTPTANILYLAAHQMLQHGGERASLRWLLDMHRLVKHRAEAIDWEALTAQAGLIGWSGALRAALEAAQACFDTPLPEGLLSTLQAQSGAHDALVDLKAEHAPTRILGEWKKLSSLNWPGRVRLLIALVIPSPAYMRWRYQPRPAWAWPLYYLYRWWDIARDGLRTLLRMLRPPSKLS